jgi:hypothetical protein
MFCIELYSLSLVYRSIRPWILYLAMNISPPLFSLTINYKFPSNSTVLLYQAIYATCFRHILTIFRP